MCCCDGSSGRVRVGGVLGCFFRQVSPTTAVQRFKFFYEVCSCVPPLYRAEFGAFVLSRWPRDEDVRHIFGIVLMSAGLCSTEVRGEGTVVQSQG